MKESEIEKLKQLDRIECRLKSLYIEDGYNFLFHIVWYLILFEMILVGISPALGLYEKIPGLVFFIIIINLVLIFAGSAIRMYQYKKLKEKYSKMEARK